MQAFWNKVKSALRTFMTGRNGTDQLSIALVQGGLVLYLLGLLFRVGVLGLLSLAAYAWAIFRMLSRNRVARATENQKYVLGRDRAKTAVLQAWNRLKNLRKYKYFKCPQCGSLLRVPRGTGNVSITCSNCGNAFKGKA